MVKLRLMIIIAVVTKIVFITARKKHVMKN